MIDLIEGLGQF